MKRVGDDLVEALTEMAAYLRGDVAAEPYDLSSNGSTADAAPSVRRAIDSKPAVVRRIPKRK